MDMSKFQASIVYDSKNNESMKKYYMQEGDYLICVRVGKLHNLKYSDPTDKELPLNKYNGFNLVVLYTGISIFDLAEFEIANNVVKDYLESQKVKIDAVSCYVNYEQLEKVYDLICKASVFYIDFYAGVKEKACKHCGKNNDMGVSSCWWCGINKPTE